MNVVEKKTGKILFFALHYVFPQGIVRTEKYQNKKQFRFRANQLKRYERQHLISNLVA